MEIALTKKHIAILAATGLSSPSRSQRWRLNPDQCFWDDKVGGIVFDPENKLIPYYGTLNDDPQFQELVTWRILETTTEEHGGAFYINHPSSWGNDAGDE